MATPAFRLPSPPASVSRSLATTAEGGDSLDRALALSFDLLRRISSFARQLDLGELDLPPVVGTEADQAHLLSVPPLYLAAELESTRLLPAVETFAGVFVSGGLAVELGPAGPQVVEFWRGRRERFTASEREALFGRLFGTAYGPNLAVDGARNRGFENLMIGLCEALTAFQGGPAAPLDAVRLRTAAESLAQNLLPRSGGIAAFAAQGVLQAVQSAVDILKHSEVQQAVGARSLWGAVRALARRYLGQDTDVGSHLARGKAGLLVLTWLAESLPHLHGPGFPPEAAEPAPAAAVTWLQASLTLAERGPSPERSAEP